MSSGWLGIFTIGCALSPALPDPEVSVAPSGEDAAEVPPGSSCAEAPLGLELVEDGGFEVPGLGWTVKTGGCEWSSEIQPPQGGLALLGGGAGDCEVVQRVDLIAQGVCAQRVDDGDLAVSMAVQVRTADSETPDNDELSPWDTVVFDDHAWLEVRFLDAGGTRIASARTPVSDRNDWRPDGGLVTLPPGTRTLEIAGIARHRRGALNDGALDDISVTLSEAPIKAPRITKQPLIYQGAQGELTLLWETRGPAVSHEVQVGINGAALAPWDAPVETQVLSAERYIQRLSLAGLPPDVELVYQVTARAHGAGIAAVAGPYTTQTLAAGDRLRVAWTGDSQLGDETFREVVEAISPLEPDLFFSVGDIVQNGMVESDWDAQWFAPLEVESFGATTPILFARGNHDHEWSTAYSYTELPGNGAWYAERLGPVFLLVLDSQWDATDSGNLSDQSRFIEEALDSAEAVSADFRVVAFHIPPYTNIWKTARWDGEPDFRDAWVPLFEQGGVDLVVNGHAHAYQRGLLNGVMYVVTGGAGGRIDTKNFGHWSFLDESFSRHHYSVMDVEGGALVWTAYGLNGAVMDSFVLGG